MSKIKQSLGPWRSRLFTGMIWLTLLVVPSWGDTTATAKYWGGGRQSPLVVLNNEFFQAMQKFANSSGTTYGDRQEFFLEQIATAEKFVVKTNLTLIEQNEKIIRLLEELRHQNQKESH